MRNPLRDVWGFLSETSAEVLAQQINHLPAQTSLSRALQVAGILTTGVVTGVIIFGPLVIVESLRRIQK